ncbi:MAG: 3-hydroxybutyryl-CoA dehydrogenase; 3-hydroxyacyl-CoA dehydrogenase [uncultured Gemmatimonadetes bacterium]|uniref:3-hydroxybutyryl-CoA dehydrogenase 3-hydroxyacyl-CoA dehydrogenase n=1 Tax=uncultured Gemmatimonadota bacterium TaxID=203437 RepID=A0A6J4LCC7_9BACT|nr:MAG: 3-hydroxybutyryl-CoA dehydrogenase; 3-hydroxyacyl-CoA dehydrogenase [uncultured Gemmatimonadota bacterium]
MAEIKRVGVLGCGLMGSGIAQVCAAAGYETIVREVSDAVCERGIGGIAKQLGKSVEKGKLAAEDRDAIVGRLRGTTQLEELRDCDIIIEAVVEDLALKNEMWKTLDEVCGPETIFASNTSSLTIADMAAATRRPERMVGLHFFNPVPVMKLVEVVKTIATDPQVFQTAFDFAASLGKEPIVCKDNSGFVVNLLLVPYMMDAIRALEQGVASIEDIDKGMKLGTGYPMGPFVLSDFVGLDTLDKIGGIMFEEYKEKRYASPPLLKRMVSLGYFGRKSGKGFYDYSGPEPVVMKLV